MSIIKNRIVFVTGLAGSGKSTIIQQGYTGLTDWLILQHDRWANFQGKEFLEKYLGFSKDEAIDPKYILKVSRKKAFIGSAIRNHYINEFHAHVWHMATFDSKYNYAIEIPFYTKETHLLVKELKKIGKDVEVKFLCEPIDVIKKRLKDRGWSKKRIKHYLKIYPDYFEPLLKK